MSNMWCFPHHLVSTFTQRLIAMACDSKLHDYGRWLEWNWILAKKITVLEIMTLNHKKI